MPPSRVPLTHPSRVPSSLGLWHLHQPLRDLDSAATSPHPRLGSNKPSSQILGGHTAPSGLILVPPEAEACYPGSAVRIKRAKICAEQPGRHTGCSPSHAMDLSSRSPCHFRFPKQWTFLLLFLPLLSVPSRELHPQSPSPLISSTFRELIHSQNSTCPACTCLLGPLETSTWTSLKQLEPSLSQTQGPHPATPALISIKDSHPCHCPAQRPRCHPHPTPLLTIHCDHVCGPRSGCPTLSGPVPWPTLFSFCCFS